MRNRKTGKTEGEKNPPISSLIRNPGEERAFISTKNIPDRYTIKENGEIRSLTCFESPNITVQLERGQVTTASTARKSQSGTIYLDGAAQGAPFLEHERMIYNFDHHEGVVRAFTLSTCEQAMVMLMKGLDLSKREWRIIANEPDLDTILAVWILLNHLRVRGPNQRVRRTLMPLLRLEGAIDAHGLSFTEFTGFPEELLNKSMKTLDNLKAEETQLKKEGLWERTDFLEYAIDTLRKIDQIIYRSGEFSNFQEIEELTQLTIYKNRIAVVCRSDAGIYETEQQLKKIYGSRLALILLQKNQGIYTLRQTDLFLPGNLEQIYELLNIHDPAVSGRFPENRWGGSTDIGGSPRMTGTGLSPREIVDLCKEVFRKPRPVEKASVVLKALALGAASFAAGWLTQHYWNPHRWFSDPIPELIANPPFGFILAGTILCVALIFALTHPTRRRRLYGIELPSGWDWWLLFPLALIAGMAGGAWAPWIEPDKRGGEVLLFHILLLPLYAELLFRCMLHGLLIGGHRIQSRSGPWFVSYPVLLSALVYAVAMIIPYSPHFSIVNLLLPDWYSALGLRIVSGFLFGLLTGMIRERAESIIASYLVHLLSAVGVLFLYHNYF